MCSIKAPCNAANDRAGKIEAGFSGQHSKVKGLTKNTDFDMSYCLIDDHGGQVEIAANNDSTVRNF